MGEDLIGLIQTPQPELQAVDRGLRLLAHPYNLYTEVLLCIGRWEGVLWTKMDCELLEMGLEDSAARCRKMPKGPRGWPAYLELRQVIEDLRLTLPPLTLLQDRSILGRHWQSISDICGVLMSGGGCAGVICWLRGLLTR